MPCRSAFSLGYDDLKEPFFRKEILPDYVHKYRKIGEKTLSCFAKSCLVFNEVIRFLMTKLMGKTTTHKNFHFFSFRPPPRENDARTSEHRKIFYVLLIYHTFFDEFPLR